MEEERLKKKRRQVRVACTNCRDAHAACDETRPCRRCVSSGLEASCKDVQRRKRRKKEGTAHPPPQPPPPPHPAAPVVGPPHSAFYHQLHMQQRQLFEMLQDPAMRVDVSRYLATAHLPGAVPNFYEVRAPPEPQISDEVIRNVYMRRYLQELDGVDSMVGEEFMGRKRSQASNKALEDARRALSSSGLGNLSEQQALLLQEEAERERQRQKRRQRSALAAERSSSASSASSSTVTGAPPPAPPPPPPPLPPLSASLAGQQHQASHNHHQLHHHHHQVVGSRSGEAAPGDTGLSSCLWYSYSEHPDLDTMPSILEKFFLPRDSPPPKEEHPVAAQFIDVLKARLRDFSGLRALNHVCRMLRDHVRRAKYRDIDRTYRATNEELNLVSGQEISVMAFHDGTVIACNDHLPCMFGYSQEDLKNHKMSIQDCVHKSEMQSHMKSSLTAFNTRATHIIFSRRMFNRVTDKNFQGVGCACVYLRPDKSFYGTMFIMAEPLPSQLESQQ